MPAARPITLDEIAASQAPAPATPAARPVSLDQVAAVAKPKEDGSGWDYLGAIARGAAHAVGIPTSAAEFKQSAKDALVDVATFPVGSSLRQMKNAMEGGYRAYLRAKAAPSGQRVAQAVVSGVPLVGEPIAAVAGPGLAVSEGRPPTHEENVTAVEGGTTLGVLGAGALHGARAARLENIRRAHGIAPEAPATAPEGATAPEPPSPATEALVADAGEAQRVARTKASTPPKVAPPSAPIDAADEVGNLFNKRNQLVADEAGKESVSAPPAEPTATTGVERAAPQTFTTSKGSTYEVHSDGTTTRTKSFHPEHGAADQGPQPRSQATLYVTPEDAVTLGEVQAEGPKRTVRPVSEDEWGVRYEEGPSAGKFEKRTVVTTEKAPRVGLVPVEVWQGGKSVHFGNEITQVGDAPTGKLLRMPQPAEPMSPHEEDLHRNIEAGMPVDEALGRYQAADEKASGFHPESEIKDARPFTGKSLADMTDDELDAEAGRLAGLADRAYKSEDWTTGKAYEAAFDKTTDEANRRWVDGEIQTARENATTDAYRKYIDPIEEGDVPLGERYRIDELFDKSSSPADIADGKAIYDGFSEYRDLLRQKHGNTMRLYRADVPAERRLPNKTVLHFADTEEEARGHMMESENEGRTLVARDVPIDDIVAAPSHGKGKNSEYLVLNRDSPNAIDHGAPGGPPPPANGNGGNGNSGGAPPSSAPPPSGPPPTPPTAVTAAAFTPTPAPPPLPPVDVDDPGYHMALRTRYAGEADVRALEGNQIANWLKKTLTPAEQDALSIMRDEKGQPGSTQALIDGTHPVYGEAGASHAHVEAMSDVANLALNPTPSLLAADKVLDSYFTKTLTEGKALGVLDSSIEPEHYINHIMQPVEPTEPGRTGFAPAGISENTPFAKKRSQPTILEAMARGIEPRTINSATAISIYAKRHGMAMAAQILENTLKESDIGKSVTRSNAPEGWIEVGEGTRAFKRDVPYHDQSGKTEDGSNHIAIAHRALYAPAKIADALRPITEPNYMLKVPGWEKTQRFQDYIKSSNVALAFFHLKAITITAFNSMPRGPVDMIKAYMIGVDDPAFMASEQNLVQAGGKTSAVAQTAEAYRALEPKAFPSRVDAIRNAPVMRQFNAAAEATSKLTFDIALRKTKVMDFAAKDAAWIAQHPYATDVELATARRSTARALNANYGGLNWEALGITRTVHAFMRMFMFAPDWTWSNYESISGMFRGGAGGTQARWYMARSIAAGMGATAVMTYFMTGKKPGEVPGSTKDRLFNVYLGDDEKGNHKFVNLFFAGAPNDAVNLVGNLIDYGLGKGIGMTAAAKANLLPRLAMHVATNKDFMGRDIVPKDAGWAAGTAISIKNAAAEVAPVPFGVKNVAQMATDPKREYSLAEYTAAILAGTRPRHVAPAKPERERNSTWSIMMGGPVYGQRRNSE